MTREETLKIFAVMKANYPNFYKGMTRTDAEAQVALWCEMFADETYQLVGAALKSYIATDETGYPPNVGKIKANIRKLTQREELTEQEAVNMVLKACTNSTYNAKSEFDKLPPTLQRLVGSPGQLKEWAAMESDVVNSVVASNLMRSYKVVVEREKQQQALPSSLKNLFIGTAETMRLEG